MSLRSRDAPVGTQRAPRVGGDGGRRLRPDGLTPARQAPVVRAATRVGQGRGFVGTVRVGASSWSSPSYSLFSGGLGDSGLLEPTIGCLYNRVAYSTSPTWGLDPEEVTDEPACPTTPFR